MIFYMRSRLHERVRIDLASYNALRLFNFGVICYEIKNGRHFLVWLASRLATFMSLSCKAGFILPSYQIECSSN